MQPFKYTVFPSPNKETRFFPVGDGQGPRVEDREVIVPTKTENEVCGACSLSRSPCSPAGFYSVCVQLPRVHATAQKLEDCAHPKTYFHLWGSAYNKQLVKEKCLSLS